MSASSGDSGDLESPGGGMGEECLRYHRRLAELLAMMKGEDYAKTMN